jgi:hypothetical protein
MVMTSATQERLDQLRAATWFAAVGRRGEDAKEVIQLSSWNEAISHCASLEWQDLKLEHANIISDSVRRASIDRYRRWNEVVRSVKPLVIAMVQDKTAAVAEQQELPVVFTHAVQWDILHLCIECEYSDLCPPAFYSDWAAWYVKGRFPCGWEGEPPEGRPIIY